MRATAADVLLLVLITAPAVSTNATQGPPPNQFHPLSLGGLTLIEIFTLYIHTPQPDAFVFGSANSGFEWIELRFPNAMYITSVALYEVYQFGSLKRILTTSEYKDDNTVPCAGDSCSRDTAWDTLWEGVPGIANPDADEGRIVVPESMCPIHYKSDILRLEFDTMTVPGWNTFDAVELSGTADQLAGLVTSVDDAVHPNRIMYEPWSGVHGNDTFKFVSSDCISWSDEPGVVDVVIQPPRGAFSSAFEVPYSR